MVRAILDGRKSQTRRVVKPRRGITDRDDDGWPTFEDEMGDWHREACPYGQPGDRLWVREAWAYYGGDEYLYQQERNSVEYRADGYVGACSPIPGGRWRPSIHMPRWASRITLEITGVRVERVQAITDADARAEGCVPGERESATDAYHNLWDSLNAPRGYGWDANPFVWVIEFRPSSPEGV